MNARLKSQIDRAQMKIAKLRAKHSHWHPIDTATMKAWERMLEEVKQQAGFADHPVMKKWILYCQKTVNTINDVLMNDKELKLDERRILMEKRAMYESALELFVPREKALQIIEGEADGNLSDKHYPQPMSGYGGFQEKR